MVVKNHVFVDGNKRNAATLAALTLLIAESNPNEKDVIIDLVRNSLD